MFAAAAMLSSCTTRPTTLKDAYKDHFYVGVAINRAIATGTAVQANNVNRTQAQVDQDTALVKAQFNQISPENDLKWALVQPQPGPDGYDFAGADAYVNFGLANHMYIVGHNLVWHNQTPNWVFEGTNPPPSGADTGPRSGPGFVAGSSMYSGPRCSRDELLQRMHDHILTVVGRYKGKIQVWDVVNEAVADRGTNIYRNSLWYQIIGPDFIAKAFEYAHEADPDAILRYNDYGLEDPVKRQKFITLIQTLQAQHVPVMAIGTQTHVGVGAAKFDTIDHELTDLDTLGLPIHITELDVNGSQRGQRNTSGDIAASASSTQGGMVSNADQRQSDAYSNLFRAFEKHKSVKVVTFWGANDGVSWLARGHPLLFDANDQPKPAFNAVMNAANDAR
jgi:endo-1,4-beta-xylanase